MTAISNRIRFLVLKRDGFRCVYCGGRAGDVELEVDHVEPKSKGGPDDLSNFVTACFSCNRGKGATEPVGGAGVGQPNRPASESHVVLSRPGLVDKWFAVLDEDGAIDRYGMIRGKATDQIYLVAFMSWFTGEIVEMSLIDIGDMVTNGDRKREPQAWRFFEDEAHLNAFTKNLKRGDAEF